MIYLTGDTHNDFSKLSNKSLKKHDLKLTEDDYIIVTGDFGLCWAHDKTFDWNCKWFAERSFTTLWVQGNHENYDMIAEYPLEEWHGGRRKFRRNRRCRQGLIILQKQTLLLIM